MKKETVFQRYEFKYLLTRGQQARLLSAAGARLRPDEYSHSSIRNLYLDTPDFRLIRRSLEKPVYKEKLRLRSYGRADWEHPVFMELKKKYRSVVYKRRLTLPYGRALDCLAGDCPWPETQIGRARSATPWTSIRIWSPGCSSPTSGTPGMRRRAVCASPSTTPSASWGHPLWMVRLLTEMGLYKTSFSKYGTAYQILLEQEYKGGKRYA